MSQADLLLLILSSTSTQGINKLCLFVAMSSSTTDHDKPEALSPRVYEYLSDNRGPVSPDLEYRTPSISELANVDEQNDSRGESVWSVLGE